MQFFQAKYSSVISSEVKMIWWAYKSCIHLSSFALNTTAVRPWVTVCERAGLDCRRAFTWICRGNWQATEDLRVWDETPAENKFSLIFL
jgi:hypothetical protein